MELITLTNETKKIFGLTSAHITKEGNDYMVQLKQLSMNYVIFTSTNLDFKYGEKIILEMKTAYGPVKLNVKIDNYYDNDIMMVLECEFEINEMNNFFIEFEKYLKDLIEQKKRKEQRILCTQKNLEKLNLINKFIFEYKYRNITAIIKDISFSGIRILTNKILMEENGDIFTIKIKFKFPDESYLFLNCPIIRKKLLTIEGMDFTEAVMKLPDNVKFKKRIQNYFMDEEKSNVMKFQK